MNWFLIQDQNFSAMWVEIGFEIFKSKARQPILVIHDDGVDLISVYQLKDLPQPPSFWIQPAGNIAEFDEIRVAIFNGELLQKAFLRFQIPF